MIKVLILGRPGSGKSTAFRHIKKLACSAGWSTVHLTDHNILRDMFWREQQCPSDTGKTKFSATEHGGFDVTDFSVLDEALKELETQVNRRYNSVDEVVVIEFARDDYDTALRLFSPDFIQDAYILYIESGLDACVQRVRERVAHSYFKDDYFVSENIIRNYYQRQVLPDHCGSKYSLHEGCITIIENRHSEESFLQNLGMLLNAVFEEIQANIADVLHTPAEKQDAALSLIR